MSTGELVAKESQSVPRDADHAGADPFGAVPGARAIGPDDVSPAAARAVQDEAGRLAAVRRYDVLDTPPDGAFDRITALASRMFHVPISIVSIVDTDRIWFKSHHGLEVGQVDRDPGLCASAILQGQPWVVTDAGRDPRTLANPLVAGEFGLRFYAGIPLTTGDGYNLGTLCVIDREPRTPADVDIAALADLAALVMDELELRLSAKRVVALEEQRRKDAEELAALYERMADSLRDGLESNRLIGKALGLMMAFHKIDDTQAFDLLKKTSQDLNLKLKQVALEIVEHQNSRDQAR